MSNKAEGMSKQALLFLLFTFGISSLLESQFPARNSEIQNFISNQIPVVNQNWEVCQSPANGYIYFANSAGLVEYNGISSRTYSMPLSKGVRSVYVDAEGRIFTGSFEDFGYWDNDYKGDLTYHSMAANIGVEKNDEIWNIFELNETLYFQSFTTIYKADPNGVTTIGGPSIMLFLFKAGDRFIVQSLGLGLFWFDGSEFELIKGSEIFGSLKVHAIIEMAIGKYWICTANNGIFTFDGKSFTPQKSEISSYLMEESCNAGLAIDDSLIVFGTILRGIVFCDEEGRIQRTYDYSNGLNNNTVLSLYKGRDNGLWVGLDEGVNYINISSYVTQYENSTGSLGTIYSAIRNDDLLYLGTNHGLFVADIKNNKGDYSFSNLRIIPNTQGQVWNLVRYEGQILCGHNDGTFLLDNGTFRRISEVTGGWSFEQYKDFLLEGTYTGIVSFGKDDNNNWLFRNRIQGYSEPTRFLEVDYLGYVWAIHPQKGVYRLELNEAIDSVVNTIYFVSVTEASSQLTMSRINNQVVFMSAEYIYAFDYENKTFFPIKSLEPGLGEYIKSTQIIHSKGNSYWFIHGNRIALFNITKELEAEKVLEFFHKYTDLPWREQQIIALDNNTLLIPTRQAFSLFNLNMLNREKERPLLKINRMVFSGKSNSTFLIPGSSEKISVPNRENNLTVFLAKPFDFDQEDAEYWYRIKEIEEEWHRTTLDNFSYLNLKFGSYHLQVRTSSDIEITEERFIINRPNYLSTPAIALYFLAFIGIILLSIKVFRVELNRHRRLIEYEVGKNRLESELDYKSYELMLTMRYLIRKTDVLRELRDKLDLLKAYSSKFPVKYIRDMERIIDHGLDSQTAEWQNVMKNLKLSQEGFFRKLKQKYPSLTPNDLRLCSYLRMNFTSKEIANLINVSVRAVEIGRYRLRRKLNLDHEINLTEFLITEAEKED